MQIKSIQRTGIIGDVQLPETGKVSSERKIAPIRDTYEDGSRRNESFPDYFSGKRLKASSFQQEQSYRHNATFDLQKFFLALLLQQGRVQLDSDSNENESISKQIRSKASVRRPDFP